MNRVWKRHKKRSRRRKGKPKKKQRPGVTHQRISIGPLDVNSNYGRTRPRKGTRERMKGST